MSLCRRIILGAALLAASAVAAPSPALAAPVYTVTGGGWGHGIGLSQYGAEGMARNGATFDQILAHYFPGTALADVPDERIRVLVGVRDNPAIVVAAGSTVVGPAPKPAAGAEPVEPVPAEAAGPLAVRVRKGLVEVRSDGKLLAKGKKVTIRGAGVNVVGGTRHRGWVVLTRQADGRVLVVLSLLLDDYVRGVISREVPAEWQPATLQTQAVAARSYALAVRKPKGTFNVYDDTRSQVYGGVAAETPQTDAAVKATAGKILTFEGKVATTFFSSSTGGRTAAIEDEWGGDPVPYLVSVPDPTDAISPYFRWPAARYTPARLGAVLGVGTLKRLDVTLSPSRRPAQVVAVGPDGTKTTWFGPSLRGVLLDGAGEPIRSSNYRVWYLNLRTLKRKAKGSVEATGVVRPGGIVGLIAQVDGRWREIARTKRVATAGEPLTLTAPAVKGATGYRLRLGPATSGTMTLPPR